MTRRNSFSSSFRSPKRGINGQRRQTAGLKIGQKGGQPLTSGLGNLGDLANKAASGSIGDIMEQAKGALPGNIGDVAGNALSTAAAANPAFGAVLKVGKLGMKALEEDPEVKARKEMIAKLRNNIEKFPDDDSDLKSDKYKENIFLMKCNNEDNPERDGYNKLVRLYKKDLAENDGSTESVFGETFRLLELSGNDLVYRTLLRYLNRSLRPNSTAEELRRIMNVTYVSKCNSLGVIPLMKYMYWLNFPFVALNTGRLVNVHDAALMADYHKYFKNQLHCMNEHVNDDPVYVKGNKCKFKQPETPNPNEEKSSGGGQRRRRK
jgi:hypothetical protein